MIDFFHQRLFSSLQLGQDFQCATVGRTFGHHNINNDLVGFDVRHKALLDPARTKQTKADNEYTEKYTGGQVTVLKCPAANFTVTLIRKMKDAVGNSFLELAKTLQVMPGFHAGQVRRQDQK